MKNIFVILILAILAACSAKSPSYVAPLIPPQPEPILKIDNPGSLFQPSEATLLFEDNRAKRVGDIVLVKILEQSSASSESDTKSEKKYHINAGFSSFLGQSKFMGLPNSVGNVPLLKAVNNNKLDTSGEITRKTTVTATVAARIIRVFPNGLMELQGVREIMVNGEKQIIQVHGLIRARDIGPDNSITSNQLADAKIYVYGEGVLSDKQKQGWMGKLVDKIWPF
ncbi:flagellar basal body L-ring protein FlgH [Desulfothermus naphthae]